MYLYLTHVSPYKYINAHPHTRLLHCYLSTGGIEEQRGKAFDIDRRVVLRGIDRTNHHVGVGFKLRKGRTGVKRFVYIL